MTRSVYPCLLPVLVLVCLTEIHRSSHAHAAVLTVWCQSRNFAPGEIITTKPDNIHSYCGSPVGWYFAVKQNVLFHLECPPGAVSPTQATGAIIALTNPGIRSQTFNAQMQCEVTTPEAVTTGNNAYVIADKLNGITVPYSKNSCNAQHYVEYLAYGNVLNPSVVMSNCPVFQPFNSLRSVNANFFRLKGRESFFDWPIGKGTLQPARTSSMRMSRGKRERSPPKVVDKRGGSSGGGHSGSGGHGGRGGNGGEHGGNEGNTGARGYPYGPYTYGAGRSSSSASRSSKPMWRGWSWFGKSRSAN